MGITRDALLCMMIGPWVQTPDVFSPSAEDPPFGVRTAAIDRERAISPKQVGRAFIQAFGCLGKGCLLFLLSVTVSTCKHHGDGCSAPLAELA